jgi:UPF0716 family protein affecting phage T7 exclusion
VREFQAGLARGKVPEESVLGGVLALGGSLLLSLPGLITDVIGLVLQFPPARRLIARPLGRVLARKVREGGVTVVGFGRAPPTRVDPGRIIDVDAVPVPVPLAPPRSPVSQAGGHAGGGDRPADAGDGFTTID